MGFGSALCYVATFGMIRIIKCNSMELHGNLFKDTFLRSLVDVCFRKYSWELILDFLSSEVLMVIGNCL